MVMLIVAFAAGIAAPPARAEMHHQVQLLTVVVTAMDSSIACEHGGCPVGQNADMHGTCFVSGSAASALSPATTILYFAGTQEVLTPSFDRAMVERAIPPDPHPPKQI